MQPLTAPTPPLFPLPQPASPLAEKHKRFLASLESLIPDLQFTPPSPSPSPSPFLPSSPCQRRLSSLTLIRTDPDIPFKPFAPLLPSTSLFSPSLQHLHLLSPQPLTPSSYLLLPTLPSLLSLSLNLSSSLNRIHAIPSILLLPHLTSLKLCTSPPHTDSVYIYETEVAQIAHRFPSLTTLAISLRTETPEVYETLETLKSLTHYEISTPEFTNLHGDLIVNHLPHLHSLHIQTMIDQPEPFSNLHLLPNLTSFHLEYRCNHRPNPLLYTPRPATLTATLTALSLSHTSQLSSTLRTESLQLLPTLYPALTHLHLHNLRVSPLFLSALANLAPLLPLTHFSITCAKDLTVCLGVKVVIELTQSKVFAGLKVLDLSGVGLEEEGKGDEVLKIIAGGLGGLEELRVGRWAVGDRGMVYLGRMRRLEKVDVRGGKGSEAGLVRLLGNLPRCAVRCRGKGGWQGDRERKRVKGVTDKHVFFYVPT